MAKVFFITGIDTDIGKTIATGWYAKKLMQQGASVITQKMIQTGCEELPKIYSYTEKYKVLSLQKKISKVSLVLTCLIILAHRI